MRPAQHGDGEKVIQSWPLSNGEQLRLTAVQYKHARFLDLRRWEPADGDWRPTRVGVRFSAVLAGPLAELLGQVAGERAA